ncbi:TerB family tellurite resistance protein [Streptomyces sp. NPDC048196]|uniref:TerB family tellurite resistance protein n=1 Tax=Streptomyces sp. NPDC048196 TaxID=3154712 RepID=UPI0033E0EB7D
MRPGRVRTTWRTVDDGSFFCPSCGGDRNYLSRIGRRRLAVLNIPLVPRGTAVFVVECTACRTRFDTDVLDQPTSTVLSSMLRDAVHTVSLAVLAAGGFEDRAAREAAVGAVRDAGFDDCTEEQLAVLHEERVVGTWRLPCGYQDAIDGGSTTLTAALRQTLGALTLHLEHAGREGLLLRAARIALADGPYTHNEHQTLTAIGRALLLGREETERLLAAAARRAP